MVTTAPYGSWRSPIGVEDLTAGSTGLDAVHVDGDDLYWLESRPDQGGRVSLWRRAFAGGDATELTPAPTNVRTRVNEYGGGEYGVRDGVVVISDLADGRLRRIDPDGTVTVLTAEGPVWYGDPDVHPGRGLVVAVREDHREAVLAEHGEAVTTLVAIPLDGSAAHDLDAVTVLASGADFYSTPQLSDDGRLAWTQWDHPNMPWDSTALHVAPLTDDGLGAAETVAGGPGESAVQPRWLRRATWSSPPTAPAGGTCTSSTARPSVRARGRGRVRRTAVGPRARARTPSSPASSGGWSAWSSPTVRPACTLLDVDSGDLTPVAAPGVGADALRPGPGGAAAVLTHPDRPAELATLGADGTWTTVRTSTRQAPDPADRLGGARRDLAGRGRRRARLVPPAGQPGLRRARGRGAAADHALARRPDLAGPRRVLAVDPVLDDPRLRGARRQLRRQHRLRTRLPRTAQGPLGHRRRRRLRQRRARHGRAGPGRPRTARHQGRQRRRLHHPARPDRRPTSSPPASATTASATSRPSRATPTSSSRATSTASSAPTPRTATVYVERSPIHHVDQLTAPILLLRASRTTSSRPTRPRRWSRPRAPRASPSR